MASYTKAAALVAAGATVGWYGPKLAPGKHGTLLRVAGVALAAWGVIEFGRASKEFVEGGGVGGIFGKLFTGGPAPPTGKTETASPSGTYTPPPTSSDPNYVPPPSQLQGVLFAKFLSPVNGGTVDQPSAFSETYPVVVRFTWSGAEPVKVLAVVKAKEFPKVGESLTVSVPATIEVPPNKQAHSVTFNVPFASGWYYGGIEVALSLEVGGVGKDAVAAYVDT